MPIGKRINQNQRSFQLAGHRTASVAMPLLQPQPHRSDNRVFYIRDSEHDEYYEYEFKKCLLLKPIPFLHTGIGLFGMFPVDPVIVMTFEVR